MGSGPAGLGCAHDPALPGYEVTVFEAVFFSVGAMQGRDLKLPGHDQDGIIKAVDDLLNLNLDQARVGCTMKRKPFLIGVMILSVLALAGLGSLVGCRGGGGAVSDEAAAGKKLYGANCALCHGQGGVGKPALGKDLRRNEFLGGMTDDQVVEFLEQGRRADHPLNERGVDMPPRGGNPGLSDDDLRLIVAYLRSLS